MLSRESLRIIFRDCEFRENWPSERHTVIKSVHKFLPYFSYIFHPNLINNGTADAQEFHSFPVNFVKIDTVKGILKLGAQISSYPAFSTFFVRGRKTSVQQSPRNAIKLSCECREIRQSERHVFRKSVNKFLFYFLYFSSHLDKHT